MAISRGDVDMTLHLASPEDMAPLEAEARVYTADVAVQEGWSREDLLDQLQALGLVEAELDPARGTRHRRYPKKRKSS
jgi:hypothetical protein